MYISKIIWQNKHITYNSQEFYLVVLHAPFYHYHHIVFWHHQLGEKCNQKWKHLLFSAHLEALMLSLLLQSSGQWEVTDLHRWKSREHHGEVSVASDATVSCLWSKHTDFPGELIFLLFSANMCTLTQMNFI